MQANDTIATTKMNNIKSTNQQPMEAQFNSAASEQKHNMRSSNNMLMSQYSAVQTKTKTIAVRPADSRKDTECRSGGHTVSLHQRTQTPAAEDTCHNAVLSMLGWHCTIPGLRRTMTN